MYPKAGRRASVRCKCGDEVATGIISNYIKAMTAAAALERQILIYRRMTGEQRLAVALDLHELSCDVARGGIRRQHPEADADEVERLLRRRIELARELERPS